MPCWRHGIGARREDRGEQGNSAGAFPVVPTKHRADASDAMWCDRRGYLFFGAVFHFENNRPFPFPTTPTHKIPGFVEYIAARESTGYSSTSGVHVDRRDRNVLYSQT